MACQYYETKNYKDMDEKTRRQWFDHFFAYVSRDAHVHSTKAEKIRMELEAAAETKDPYINKVMEKGRPFLDEWLDKQGAN